MPKCIKCDEYIIAHPHAAKERPNLYKTKCEAGGVHEFEKPQGGFVINVEPMSINGIPGVK